MAGQKLINNTSAVRTQAEQLAANSIKLESVKHSIEYALNESRQSWEQSQADATKFTTELDKDIEYLENIIACNKEFAEAIENYMKATETTGSKTI